MRLKHYSLFLACLFLLLSCKKDEAPELSNKEYQDIAYEAFIYSYPILAQLKLVNSLLEKETLVKNKFTLISGFSSKDTIPNKTGVRILPNTAGILVDITKGPVIIDVPTIRDAYVAYQCIDMFTHNIFYMGTRANFGYGGRFVFYKEGQGLPNDQSIQSILLEGNYAVMLMGLLNKNGLEQKKLEEIASEVKVIYAPLETSVYPIYNEEKAFSPNFVSYVNSFMDSIPKKEVALIEGFKPIGVRDSVRLKPEQFIAVQKGIDSALSSIKSSVKEMKVLNGYSSSLGYYGNPNLFKGNYLKRATGAFVQLWSNSPEESVWYRASAEGEGKIHFNKKDFPPLGKNGFMTVSILDPNNNQIGKSLTFTKEMLDRKDAFDLYFSSERQKDYWLMIPEGSFTISLEVFLPETTSVIDYTPPQFEKEL